MSNEPFVSVARRKRQVRRRMENGGLKPQVGYHTGIRIVLPDGEALIFPSDRWTEQDQLLIQFWTPMIYPFAGPNYSAKIAPPRLTLVKP